MNYLNTGALLLAAYLAVFLAACRTPLSDFLVFKPISSRR